MNVAIYARKSTVQERDESVELQVARCRELAAARGWTLDDRRIFTDTAKSGAEFDKRPGLQALLGALEPGPAPFQILLVTDRDRLGREQYETAFLLKRFAQAGVAMVETTTGRPISLDTPTARLLVSVQGYAGEVERDQARVRTHAALLVKAKARHVTGGRVFGYRNFDVFPEGVELGARPKRLHVERVVHDAEGAVVRRIFELCAGGLGLRSIAHQLNDEGALAPIPRRARPRGWAPSSVREVLHRELYRGRVTWNKTKKRDGWGQKHQQPRPEAEWVDLAAPELRIVTEEQWEAARRRLDGIRQNYLRGTDGQLWGRPPSGIESKYLLTGLAVCAWCGGSLHVRSRSHGRRRAFFYACTSYHHRGRKVCENSLEWPMPEIDEAVVASFEAQLLDPGVGREVVQTILAAVAEAQHGGHDAARAVVEAELTRVEAGARRLLTLAQLAGSDLPMVAQELTALQRRRGQLEAERAGLAGFPALTAKDCQAIEAELVRRMADWRAKLRGSVMQARQLLSKLLAGRIVFTPALEPASYAFLADSTLVKVSAGLLLPKPMVAPPGFEPVFTVRNALAV